MSKQARDENNIPVERVFVPGTTQSVAYTGTAGVITNPISANVTVVRVVCTTDAFIKVGTSPTATTGDMPMFAKVPELIQVKHDGTDKISAIQSAAGGTLYVTELG